MRPITNEEKMQRAMCGKHPYIIACGYDPWSKTYFCGYCLNMRVAPKEELYSEKEYKKLTQKNNENLQQ